MCKLMRLLFIAIPFHSFRDFLIGNHLSNCPRCQKEWELDQETVKSFAMPDWIKKESSLWPRIQAKIKRSGQEKILSRKGKATSRFLRWQWAVTSLALFIFVGLILVINKVGLRPRSITEISLASKNPQVNIIRAEIQGKKAKTFIYQTKENLFIWFDELNQEED
jgi:hypothetical protein